jgi:hypothetical protein
VCVQSIHPIGARNESASSSPKDDFGKGGGGLGGDARPVVEIVPSESVEGDDYIVPDACFAGQPTVSFKPGEIGRGCRSHRQTGTMMIAFWVDLWKSSAPAASSPPGGACATPTERHSGAGRATGAICELRTG